jgi:hypothetical protein
MPGPRGAFRKWLQPDSIRHDDVAGHGVEAVTTDVWS